MVPTDESHEEMVRSHVQRIATVEARVDYLEAAREEQLLIFKEAMSGLRQLEGRLDARVRKLEIRIAMWCGAAAAGGGVLGQMIHSVMG